MPIDSRVKGAGVLAKKAFKSLKEIQTGEKPIIKTGQDFIDCHIGGLLPGDAILIGASSGTGKTKLLYDTLELMMSENINANAKNFVSLDYSLEMKFLNKILRDVNKKTEKSKTKILKEEFTKEEKDIVKSYYEALKDDRRFVCEESVTVKDFFNITKDFCEENKEKDAIFISIDHVMLLLNDNRSEDKAEVLTSYINILRKQYGNVYFILLSQFNRANWSNAGDRNNEMLPKPNVIYGSSHFEFLCSYIVGMIDPFKMGVNEFMNVNPERYGWLEDYMTEPNKKGKVAFETLGNMFYVVMKTRESDVPYKNLFIRPMELTEKQLSNMKSQVSNDKKITEETPTFEPEPEPNPYKDLKPNFNTKDAFDQPPF